MGPLTTPQPIRPLLLPTLQLRALSMATLLFTSLASVRLRLNPTMDWAMVMGATAMVAICMERGQLRLKPNPTTAMVGWAMVMDWAIMDLERGLLRLRPSPTMDWAMASMAMVGCALIADK